MTQRTFLGHPIGLYVLFLTEMWERFSYYGMRALLMLYMLNYLKMAQGDASFIYKWYTSLVYLTPILGGYLADRYLGNKWAVVIGAVLMAVGHFLMAFERVEVFYAALVFLIFGNGFFKPNMSTQVGRLYPPNDPRRDGAYTIFYMGINLGAFLSPLVCGWLAEHTVGKYHSGFTVAGIGMVLGLVVYLVGLRVIVEVDQTVADRPTPGPEASHKETAAVTATPAERRPEPPLSEDAAARTASVFPLLTDGLPVLLVWLGGIAAVIAPLLVYFRFIHFFTAIAVGILAGTFLVSAWIVGQLRGALRDRVLAIFILGVFVVFFWAAFEQAGNALTVWADKSTDRYMSARPAPVDLFPPAAGDEGAKTAATTESPSSPPPSDKGLSLSRWVTQFALVGESSGTDQSLSSWFVGLWNPIPTAWFQSINALAIFVLAPVFAYIWVRLESGPWAPSIPMKMVLGLVFAGLSFAVMIGAAASENRPSEVELPGDHLPAGIKLDDRHRLCRETDDKSLEPLLAGRLRFDPAKKTVLYSGVFSDVNRDEILGLTVPESFNDGLDRLNELIKKRADGDDRPAELRLDPVPPGFDLRYAGFAKTDAGFGKDSVRYDPATNTLSATDVVSAKLRKELAVAAADPGFRDTLNRLMIASSAFRVSPWWLFWSYILATLGELCLSPVGLSMVSKLAPARFATMLMGMWLLTSFFGNFAAGAFGESWESFTPGTYFTLVMAVVFGAAVVLLFLVPKTRAMMHGVR